MNNLVNHIDLALSPLVYPVWKLDMEGLGTTEL